MREKIINALDIVVWTIGILIALAGVIGAIGVMFAPTMPGSPPGIILGLLILLVTALYFILFLGAFFMSIGNYRNIKKIAENTSK